MTPSRLFALISALLLALVTACGGGGAGGLASLAPSPIGGGGSGGIGGTGFTTSGTIDGTGSIFVNGVRFDVSNATIRIDGEPAAESDLAPGMVVTVSGTRNDSDPARATADRVDYERDLIGPVDSVEINADRTSLRLRILDRSVIAERNNTVFSGTGFDTLTLGDFVEVSGLIDEQGRLRATRIARQVGVTPEPATVKVQATVRDLVGSNFTAGQRTVRAAGATLVNLPGGALANGQRVEIEGRLEGDAIVATRVSLVGSLVDNLQSGDVLRVQGALTDFAGRGDFRVRDIPVNGDSARLELAGNALRNGLFVEIDGTWNGTTLGAEVIRVRRGRIRADARVSDIDASAGTLILQFATGSITLEVDPRTLITDDEDDDEGFLSLANLRTGDFLRTEALQRGDRLIATRVRREDDVEEDLLQAPLERFESGVSVTLLGITFETAGADFETLDDESVSAATFYASASVGDLLRVEDDERADGIADEVAFESAVALAGDREFPEPDDSDDDSDNDVDDDNDEGSDDDDSPTVGAPDDDDTLDDDLDDDDPDDDDLTDDEADDDLDDEEPDDDLTDD